MSEKSMPYVRIVQQPNERCRFRYKCEGRPGSIMGSNSSCEVKSYPMIQVCNYTGPAIIVVSCVSRDTPYRPHPHELAGKDCERGICTTHITDQEDMLCVFNLGIQCVKRNEIEHALTEREQILVDPYRTGFDHKAQPNSIDLQCIRLCFQVFIREESSGKVRKALQPIVSDPIYDRKSKMDLVICKVSGTSAPACGGSEHILLCDKVSKDDIEVRFYEEDMRTGQLRWEGQADFQPADVHKQVAIAFKVPQYVDQKIIQPVQVFMQLRRPSDGVTSEPKLFHYFPNSQKSDETRKIRKIACKSSLSDAPTDQNVYNENHIILHCNQYLTSFTKTDAATAQSNMAQCKNFNRDYSFENDHCSNFATIPQQNTLTTNAARYQRQNCKQQPSNAQLLTYSRTPRLSSTNDYEYSVTSQFAPISGPEQEHVIFSSQSVIPKLNCGGSSFVAPSNHVDVNQLGYCPDSERAASAFETTNREKESPYIQNVHGKQITNQLDEMKNPKDVERSLQSLERELDLGLMPLIDEGAVSLTGISLSSQMMVDSNLSDVCAQLSIQGDEDESSNDTTAAGASPDRRMFDANRNMDFGSEQKDVSMNSFDLGLKSESVMSKIGRLMTDATDVTNNEPQQGVFAEEEHVATDEPLNSIDRLHRDLNLLNAAMAGEELDCSL